jgi:hypothetical protein
MAVREIDAGCGVDNDDHDGLSSFLASLNPEDHGDSGSAGGGVGDLTVVDDGVTTSDDGEAAVGTAGATPLDFSNLDLPGGAAITTNPDGSLSVTSDPTFCSQHAPTAASADLVAGAQPSVSEIGGVVDEESGIEWFEPPDVRELLKASMLRCAGVDCGKERRGMLQCSRCKVIKYCGRS